MILECNCGKVYRIKDDPGNVPTRCPSCGKVLRIAADSAPSASAADARVKELEARLQDVEKERASERAALEEMSALKRDLEEARQSIARLGAEHAKAHAAHLEALKKKDLEIHEYAARCQEIRKSAGENIRVTAPEAPASDAPATPETAETAPSPDSMEVAALPETESVLEMGNLEQAAVPEPTAAPPTPEKKGFFSKMFGKKD